METARLREIRNHYNNQSAEHCLKLLTATEHKQIVLIRHARPDIKRSERVGFDEAECYLNNYRKSGIVAFEHPPVCSDNLPAMNIYCSTLERARQTAQHMFPGPEFTIVEEEGLRELDRENIRLPFTVSHRLHTSLSRLAWLLGMQQSEETFSGAMKRINRMARKFDALSEGESLIIIVAHGFQNYFLARRLRKLGWNRVFDNGHAHLSVKILVK